MSALPTYTPRHNEDHLTLVENFSFLGAEAHAASRDAGWWTDPRTGFALARNRGEMMMLMVSELAEMHDALRGNFMSTRDEHLPGHLSFVVEAADFCIRVGDFVHGFGGDLGACVNRWSPAEVHNAGTGIMGAVRCVAAAMEHDRKGRRNACDEHLALGCLVLKRYMHGVLPGFPDWALFGAAHEKIAYNRQRADHKLENRALPGGKAY